MTRRILIPLAIAVGLAGCGGTSHHQPYKPAARPPLGRLAPPPVCAKLRPVQHRMGACLPHARPPFNEGLPRAATILGPDLSNNDPVYGSRWAAIAQRDRFAYLKSMEGTGYYDPTARQMAADAKAHGVPVGGYDFQHVCGDSASAEAAFFVRSLYAQGLLGAHTLRPAADAEYGSGSCGGRTWENTWVATVYALDGHVCPDVYTGAWWWNPNLGTYWPSCQGHDLLSWISGYGVSFPYMPSGLGHLDLHQFSDHGFNGASYADLSVFRDGDQAFASFSNQTPPPAPYDHCLRKPLPQTHGCGMLRHYFWVLRQDRAKVQSRLVEHHCSASSHPSYCRGWFWARARDDSAISAFVKKYS